MEIGDAEFHGLKLLAHCGGGAFGDVFYCQDISGQKMAVKIVSKKKLGDSWERELKGVINYRKITQSAPELLQIYHVEEDQEHFFYTMEAADSVSEQDYKPDTLASRLNRAPLPQDEVFGILSAIFAGIKTIHDAGFAHRDIKPDNILFVKGVPKLGDIGLMSALSTMTTQLAGTLDYLPPEIRTAEYDESSNPKSTQKNDLYAFGKVIYCAVTGQSPQAWPTIPKELPLTLPLKLFLRLSLRLCDKDPTKRIHSINELEKELSEIDRKLKIGETLRDKAAYHLKCLMLGLRSGGAHFCSFLWKHWLLSIIVLALVSGAIWYFYPEPPFDISKQETKLYTNDELGISMTVPFQWDIISQESMLRIYEESLENEELTEDERERLEMLVEIYSESEGMDTIYMDYKTSAEDVLTISYSTNIEFFDFKDDGFAATMREVLKEEFECDVEIYEAKMITYNGQPCRYLDFWIDSCYMYPSGVRFNKYMFVLDGYYITISCVCAPDRYQMRKEQFAQVLQSIKFEKKQNPVSESGLSK